MRGDSPLQISSRPALDRVVPLLAAAHLPTEDLTQAHCESFFYSGPADAPTGLVGLEVFGDVALLRSLVVSAERRGAGEGRSLLRHAEEEARARGVRTLYLLTTTAEQFFARRGYSRVAREAAPDAIRATREFSGICPASSAFMARAL
jgi:amino-acid N-acetyltransferase